MICYLTSYCTRFNSFFPASKHFQGFIYHSTNIHQNRFRDLGVKEEQTKKLIFAVLVRITIGTE